jgi:hypothetical protein
MRDAGDEFEEELKWVEEDVWMYCSTWSVGDDVVATRG